MREQRLARAFSYNMPIVISLTKQLSHHTAGGMTHSFVQETIDRKPTVLIVDDEAAPRAALTQILKEDFNILTAKDGRHALAVINDRGVDLITLDLKLPDTSGADILKEIKRTHREIEVIMVTAYGSLQSAMDCVRHGAAGFLLKPFNAVELLSISLQTSQKKQRLDMLREAMAEHEALWQPDPGCTEAWQALMARYARQVKSGLLEVSSRETTSPLIQLISDLLEARDRHLVNHGNRVSFYATLVGNKLQLPLAEQQHLSLGALAHDLDLICHDSSPVLHHDSHLDAPSSGSRCAHWAGHRTSRLKPCRSSPSIMNAGTAPAIPSPSKRSGSPTWLASSRWPKRSTNSPPNDPAQTRPL